MAVSISYVDAYKHYGRCVKLENDLVEALITIDVGPRIIYYAAKGGENLFHNDDNNLSVTKSPLYKQLFGEDAEYHYYGGLRMWLAPQRQFYTESPDSVPVDCKEIENGVVLTCPEATVIGFIAEMTVIMDPEKPEIEVTAKYTNTSDTPKQNAVWQIAQCAAGGVGFFPLTKPFMMPKKPFSEMTLDDFAGPLLPGGNLVYFLGGPSDKRLIVDDRYISFSQSPERQRPMKIGTLDTQGWALFANKGYMLTFRFEHDPKAVYTDYSCSLEAFTDPSLTEIEALGPLEEYKKGESISHTQTIAIQPLKAVIPDLADREAVKEFIEMHL